MSELERARLLRSAGRYAEAASLLGDTLASEPESASALTLLADCRHQLHDLDSALAAADAALAIEPDRLGALRIRTFVLHDLGRGEEARRTAEEAVRIAPEDWRTHFVLARVHRDGTEALRSAEQAVSLQPGAAVAHVMVASLAEGLGRLDEAERAYLEALRLEPNDAPAHRGLAGVRARRRRPLAALRTIARSLRADPVRGVDEQTLSTTALLVLRRARWVSVVCVILGLYGMAIPADTGPYPYLGSASLVPRVVVLGLIALATYWSLGRPLRRLPADMRASLLKLALRRGAVARRAAIIVGLTVVAVVVTLIPLR